MAEREATLANNYGLDLDNYTVSLVNVQGDIIDRGRRLLTLQYINPDFSVQKNLDNQATETLLRQKLDFQYLVVDKLTVTTGAGSEQDVQIVSIHLYNPNFEAWSSSVPNIIRTLGSDLNKINQDSDNSLIAVCWLWVTNDNGNVSFLYLYDLELGMQKWGKPTGRADDWFPQPAPTWVPTVTQTITQPAYPYP
jgi:hypothetical protein